MKLSAQLLLTVGAVPNLSSFVRPVRSLSNDSQDSIVEQCGNYIDSTSDYDSAYYNDDVCQRECTLRPVGDDAIAPFIYGPTNRVYKVYGTEKLGKKKVKKSYRAVIQIEENDLCDYNSLQRLRYLFGSNPPFDSNAIQFRIEIDLLKLGSIN